MSILGVYKKSSFNNKLRIGTPDPSKYHDSRSVRLEGADKAVVGAKIPPNEKFNLPGTVVPHATRHGGSMGWDSEKPAIVFIDPEQTNGQIRINLKDIQQNPQALADAMRESPHADAEDAIVEAFAQFAAPIAKSAKKRVYEEPMEPIREAPIQMPGTYVVPRASSGGGQVKPASFTKKRQPEPVIEEPVNEEVEESVMPAKAAQVTRKARSLYSELAGHGPVQTASAIVRKVTFELPAIGQFVCYYSDVIRDGMNLILINDNLNPNQVAWYPPTLDDQDTGEPVGVAVLVHGIGGEEDVLYKAFPTGVQFKYRNETFCLLTIEKSKSMNMKE